MMMTASKESQQIEESLELQQIDQHIFKSIKVSQSFICSLITPQSTLNYN
jgi:hypothetical protein